MHNYSSNTKFSSAVSTNGDKTYTKSGETRKKFNRTSRPFNLSNVANFDGLDFKGEKTVTWDHIIYKHGPGTRTHDIADTSTTIIKSYDTGLEISVSGPKITVKGNRSMAKIVTDALISAFQVRKLEFGSCKKHGKTIIAGYNELNAFLTENLKDLEPLKDEVESANDTSKVAIETKVKTKNTSMNRYSALFLDGVDFEETVEPEPSEIEVTETNKSVKLSKKQRKERDRKLAEELRWGPSLSIGGLF
jgi:hypothetical protein